MMVTGRIRIKIIFTTVGGMGQPVGGPSQVTLLYLLIYQNVLMIPKVTISIYSIIDIRINAY
jgi:hypothetical protein